jgi:uncharacterized protein YbjT (DUF2867 family)
MTTLLVGATGNTGGVVASELAARGVPFRCLVRSDANAAKVRALGYTPAVADLDRPETLGPALDGIERAYLVCTPDERMVPRECAFVDAARAAGVRRVVKLSAYAAAPDAPSKNLRDHAAIEAHLRDAGMEWTVLRPHGFMQTFVLFSLDFVKRAGLYLHSAGDGAMPLVDVRDVGRAAARALLDDGYTGQSFDLTGPEALTFAAQAEQLARAFGRPVTYVDGDEASLERAMRFMGVAPQSIEHVTVIMRLCRERRIADTADGLAQLGIPATTFAAFAEDLAAGRTGGGNSFQPPSGIAFRVASAATIWGYRAKFAVLGRP